MTSAAKFRLALQGDTASRILNTHGYQRQTDRQHDKASNQRWEPVANPPDDCAEEEVENATNDDAPKQGTHTGRLDNRNHDGDKGETRTLHDGQTSTNWTKANGLKERGDACKQHRHLNQKHQVG